MKSPKIYVYSFDGKTFIAEAKSWNNFKDIINSNSDWGRYSVQHLKGYTRICDSVDELGAFRREIFKENKMNGITAMWSSKWLEIPSFFKFFRENFPSFIILQTREYDSLKAKKKGFREEDIEKIQDVVTSLEGTIKKLKGIQKHEK